MDRITSAAGLADEEIDVLLWNGLRSAEQARSIVDLRQFIELDRRKSRLLDARPGGGNAVTAHQAGRFLSHRSREFLAELFI